MQINQENANKNIFITITLKVNVLNHQPKDTGWLNGFKTKTHIYAAYKRSTSELDRKRYSMWMETKRMLQLQSLFQTK